MVAIHAHSRRLRKDHGIESGVPVLLSTERPRCKLVASEAMLAGSPQDFQVRLPPWCRGAPGHPQPARKCTTKRSPLLLAGGQWGMHGTPQGPLRALALSLCRDSATARPAPGAGHSSVLVRPCTTTCSHHALRARRLSPTSACARSLCWAPRPACLAWQRPDGCCASWLERPLRPRPSSGRRGSRWGGGGMCWG